MKGKNLLIPTKNKRHYLRVKTTGEQLEGGAGPMTGKPCAQAQEDI